MKIEISNLGFRYRGRSFELRIPALTIASGEQLLISGSSGTGKSTLLRLIAGIHTPGEGVIRVNGEATADWGEKRRTHWRGCEVGFIFQDFRLVPYLNVRENIRLPYRVQPSLHWDSKAEDRRLHLLERAGIFHLERARVGELSEGEKQRVAICRTLIHQPALILADEPTGSLDETHRDAVIDLLLNESTRLGATLVLVSHDHSLRSRFERSLDLAECLAPPSS